MEEKQKKEIIFICMIGFLFIVFSLLGALAGGQEICKNSGGEMVKGFKCVNISSLDYCKDENFKIYKKIPLDYDNFTLQI